MGNIASDMACAPCAFDGSAAPSSPGATEEDAGSSASSSPRLDLLVAPGSLRMEPAHGGFTTASTAAAAAAASTGTSPPSSSPAARSGSSTPASARGPISARSDSSTDDNGCRDSIRSSSHSSSTISSAASGVGPRTSTSNPQHLVQHLDQRLTLLSVYLRNIVERQVHGGSKLGHVWTSREVQMVNQLLDLMDTTREKAEECLKFLNAYEFLDNTPAGRQASSAAWRHAGRASPAAGSKAAAEPLGPAARAQQLQAQHAADAVAAANKKVQAYLPSTDLGNNMPRRQQRASDSSSRSLDDGNTSRGSSITSSPRSKSSTDDAAASRASSNSSTAGASGPSSANWRSPHGFGCNTSSSSSSNSSNMGNHSMPGGAWGSAPPSRDPSSGGAAASIITSVLSVVGAGNSSNSSSSVLAPPTNAFGTLPLKASALAASGVPPTPAVAAAKAAALHLVTAIEGRPEQPVKRQPRLSTVQAQPAPCMYYGCNKPLSQLPIPQRSSTAAGAGRRMSSTDTDSSSSSSRDGEASWWGSYLAVAEQQGYATAAGWLLVQGTSALVNGAPAPTPAAAVVACT